MSVPCRTPWNTKDNAWIPVCPLGLEIQESVEILGLQLQNYRSESFTELSKVFKALSMCFQWSWLLIVSLESEDK